MKKIAVIFFAALYLISISGVAVSSFYCCGKLKEIFVFQSKVTPKNCKGNKLPGCCDTKTTLVKVKDDHSASQQFKLSANDFPINNFTALLFTGYLSCPVAEPSLLSLSHAPPLISDQPVYLSVNSFLI
jgi:hypothetical protein